MLHFTVPFINRPDEFQFAIFSLLKRPLVPNNLFLQITFGVEFSVAAVKYGRFYFVIFGIT